MVDREVIRLRGRIWQETDPLFTKNNSKPRKEKNCEAATSFTSDKLYIYICQTYP